MTDEHIERLESLVKHFEAGGQTLFGGELSGRYAESIRELLSASNPAEAQGWKLVPVDLTHEMHTAADDAGFGHLSDNEQARYWQTLLAASPAARAQPVERDKWVAKVRVTHKGYSMELSKYIAYALPEGVHELYAASQPPRTEQPADVKQCGCQISHAEFSPTGELERVTIHYGDSRVAYVTLPTQSAEAQEDERATLTFEDLRLWHCSQRERFSACADVQSKAAGRPFFDKICFRKGAVFHADAASLLEAHIAPPASVDNVARQTFEEWARDPQHADKIPLAKHPNGAYSDSRSYLIFYGWKSALKHGVAPKAQTGRSLTDEQTEALKSAIAALAVLDWTHRIPVLRAILIAARPACVAEGSAPC